ncbi:50S ribosomal protein L2 [Paramicrosporidium saccamoebae]|uniref:50S ribosomal protein L2 n=1 Tax=Paramicrosporidium saccamoebae TaxID=1246581 RepID=A0A2H9TKU2_9FUNG|nr:50S ribosomal protein L2 [Paramicrosporidium saccamoebae]
MWKRFYGVASMPLRDVRGSNPLTLLGRKGLLQQLPTAVAATLKPDLKLTQLRNAVRMHARQLPFPEHMLDIDPLTVIPVRGAHPALSVALRKKGGRNHHGKITCRHRGGGFKRRIRLLDKSRLAKGQVVRIEHDPNRSAKIALVKGVDGRVFYVLAWDGCKAGDTVDMTGQRNGTTLSLLDIALGTTIHNIETRPGQGGQLCRSAGTKAVLVGKSGGEASIKLPSGVIRKLSLQCRATIGVVGNAEWHLRILGKAGRRRNLGWRPTVRGVAMNANDHPHGGGKGGRSKGKPSQSPWGKICK